MLLCTLIIGHFLYKKYPSGEMDTISPQEAAYGKAVFNVL